MRWPNVSLRAEWTTSTTMTPDQHIRTQAQHDVLDGLQSVVEENLTLLTPVDKAWQPTDYLPDLTREDWRESVQALRDGTKELSDELLVVLVGDMITEEALPNYAISLNLLAHDGEGDAKTPWARWLRGWTSEENRHGDLLNAFLRLTGRVDMRAVEVTVHHLISGGFNPKAYPEPYGGLVYTSFQERATKISHARVGKVAHAQHNPHLTKICAKIAHDEGHHEQFYTTIMGEVFQRDPAGGVLAFRNLIRRVIAMPGRLMYDGKDPDLFEHFAAVAQRLSVYTVYDYISILGHLVETWKIGDLSLSGKAASAQEFLCVQTERLGSIAEAVNESVLKAPRVKFSWIHDRLA